MLVFLRGLRIHKGLFWSYYRADLHVVLLLPFM